MSDSDLSSMSWEPELELELDELYDGTEDDPFCWKDGDVFFVLGEHPATTTIQVSSEILSAASPVFAALLGPHFCEGKTLSKNSTVEIPLPEDNLEAITNLCRVLHLPHGPILDYARFRTQSLFNLAIVLDKVSSVNNRKTFSNHQQYDCVSSFDQALFYCHAHKDLHSPFFGPPGWNSIPMRLAAIAYMLQLPRCFTKATNLLTLHCGEHDFNMSKGEDGSKLPLNMFRR